MEHPNKELIALGVRQPWAELILRGIKTIEVRTVPTSLRGPIYLYSSKVVATTAVARSAARRYGLEVDALPRGLLVGTVNVVACERCRRIDADAACLPEDLVEDKLGWRLEKAHRLAEPLRPRFLPYGVWFYPFHRKNGHKS